MGNNTTAVDRLLREHHARAEPDGPRLHLVGIGLNTHICVGDAVLVEGDRLGIKRSKPVPTVDKYVIWTGENLLEVDDFLQLYGIRLEVMSDLLNIHGGHQLIASLRRGDRVTKASTGEIVVTRAGEHYRV